MALYYVLPRCEYFRPGTYVESGEDGFVQEVGTVTEGGRLKPMGFRGVCVPLNLVQNDLLKVQKDGLDRPQRW